MKIVLIDDDVFLRDMYATKFIDMGHDIQEFEYAEDALNFLLEGNECDVILVDMVMPGMSGVQFLKNVTEKNASNGAIAIVLSNQGQDADIDEAKEAGAHDYIVKAEYVPSEVVKKTEEIHGQYKK